MLIHSWNDYFGTKYIYLPSNFVKIKSNETKLVIIQFLFKLTSNSSGVNIYTLKQLFLFASHCRIYGISEHYVKGKYFIWWLIRCSEKDRWRGYKGGKIEETKWLQSSWLEKLRQTEYLWIQSRVGVESQCKREAMSSVYNRWVSDDDIALFQKYSIEKYKSRIEPQIIGKHPG